MSNLLYGPTSLANVYLFFLSTGFLHILLITGHVSRFDNSVKQPVSVVSASGTTVDISIIQYSEEHIRNMYCIYIVKARSALTENNNTCQHFLTLM